VRVVAAFPRRVFFAPLCRETGLLDRYDDTARTTGAQWRGTERPGRLLAAAIARAARRRRREAAFSA
jgi:hypothetical protein